MRERIKLYRRPELRHARLIMAWPDTGHVGLRVVEYLKTKLGAERLGRIEPDDFSLVPWVSVREGVIERLELMKNEFYGWKNTQGGEDLLIFRSEQPTAKTHEYVALVLEVASLFGVERLYTAGSFGATGITHTEEPLVLGVVNEPSLRQFLESNHVKPYPEYKGVGNIHSSFLWYAKGRGMQAISLWSPMPYYVARLPLPWSNYPKCSLAILQKLIDMENIRIDTGELESLARQTEADMAKIYDELCEQAKSEFAYPSVESATAYTEDAAEPISDDDLKRMMRDLDDFFRKGE